MASRTLYLIRHGQYTPGETSDELGNGLTALGKQQAAHAAELLKNVPFSAIYCSTLRRAVETAEIIATRFPVIALQPSRDLWEFIPTVPPAYAAFFAQQLPNLTPETLTLNRKLGDSAFDRLFRMPNDSDPAESHELIVAHGNLIAYFVCRAMGMPDDLWIQMETYNCGISRILMGKSRLGSDLVKLVSFNDFAYLPPELRTL